MSETKRKPLMRIHTAGNVPDDLLVWGLQNCCGKICSGVSVSTPKGRGSWVINRKDILRLAAMLEKKPLLRTSCYHHRAIR